MLLVAAERTPGLRKEPLFFVVQLRLSDFYVEYQINAALDRAEQPLPVLSNLHLKALHKKSSDPVLRSVFSVSLWLTNA